MKFKKRIGLSALQKQRIQRTFKTVVLMVLLGFTLTTQAQVTVGSDELPVEGSILQLKEIQNVTDDGYNAFKGLALPRVMLSDKKQLYPMFLANPALPYDATGNPATPYYINNKAKLDKTHKGLIVYNLVEDNVKELGLGLNQWDGEQWNCFESKMGSAGFSPVDCSDIVVNGVYIEGTATTSGNYIAINLNVTKAGAFTFTVTSGNGYSFYLSGVALSVGAMTVNIPCQGTPVNVQNDILAFDGIVLSSGCEPKVNVVSSVAEYSLNCSSIAVNGEYLKGQNLTGSNSITINLTVTSTGSYSITTPLTNGIRFSASGTFTTTGTHAVNLAGYGSPTVNSDFLISIEANTLQGNDVCSATIPITLPAMTYAVIGIDVWSWAAEARLQALTNGDISFGSNGIVKIKKFSQLWHSLDVATATTKLSDNSEKPDVVLYFAYGASPDTYISTALVNYIKKGGCVIYGSSDGTSVEVNTLMNGIFGMTPAIPQSVHTGEVSDDDVYPIANLPNDPIINGPFGNLSSRHWGEDNASTGSVIMTELPANSVQICTARSASKTSQDPQYSIVWYNDTYNFVYFGDSTGALRSNPGLGDYPAYYSSFGLPLSKNYGPAGFLQFVYNSALELNAVAWAVKKAAVSGINPH
jgi:hypothetical protein